MQKLLLVISLLALAASEAEDGQEEQATCAAATYGRPFSSLPMLRRGDKIRVDGALFVVPRSAVVRPWEIWIRRFRGLVLSACHPAGRAADRYVVFAAPQE